MGVVQLIVEHKIMVFAVLLVWLAGNINAKMKLVDNTSLEESTLPTKVDFDRTTPFTVSTSPVQISDRQDFILERYGSLLAPVLNPTCSNVSALAYQGNWCGAPDSSSYLETNMAMFTCSGRCGKAPLYGNPRLECACDERCYIHGDCCLDMATLCSATYDVGRQQYGHLSPVPESCRDFGFFMHSTCKRDSNGLESSEWNEFPPPMALAHPPISSWWLTNLFKGLDSFRVADLFLKVVFNSSATFNSCRVERSEPLFVSVVNTMKCTDNIYPKTGHPISVMRILERCKSKGVRDAVPRFDRSCPRDVALICRCAGSTHMQLLHNACIDQQNYQSFIRKYPFSFHFNIYAQWRNFSDPQDEHQCVAHNFSMARPDELQTLGLGNNHMHFFRVTPVVTWHNVNRIKSIDKSVESERGGELRGKGILHYCARSSETRNNATVIIHFEVEFTRALERRMRCESFDNHLSDCCLLECSKSAIPSYSPHAEYRYNGGLSCVVPDRVDIIPTNHSVRVQMCTCLRAQVALSRLMKWAVVRFGLDSEECRFQLTPNVEEPSSWDEDLILEGTRTTEAQLGDTSESAGKPGMGQRADRATHNINLFEDDLRKLWFDTEYFCPYDKSYDYVLMNFYSDKFLGHDAEPSSWDEDLILGGTRTTEAQLGDTSESAGKPGMGQRADRATHNINLFEDNLRKLWFDTEYFCPYDKSYDYVLMNFYSDKFLGHDAGQVMLVVLPRDKNQPLGSRQVGVMESRLTGKLHEISSLLAALSISIHVLFLLFFRSAS
ncbi:hypothetical protein EGW08_008021 [Elysia chlorotica]|uniref:SMB domain-containing protein n=1 Tax=Elysia chlorotica TaxID=188477 RepID=A0A3S0ZQ49_ELYCH|nr:hypothetical protein EGW08_008021 [Elysia chlorotica]